MYFYSVPFRHVINVPYIVAELVFWLLSLLLIIKNESLDPPTNFQEIHRAEEHVKLSHRNSISKIQIMGDATEKQSGLSTNCKGDKKSWLGNLQIKKT